MVCYGHEHILQVFGVFWLGLRNDSRSSQQQEQKITAAQVSQREKTKLWKSWRNSPKTWKQLEWEKFQMSELPQQYPAAYKWLRVVFWKIQWWVSLGTHQQETKTDGSEQWANRFRKSINIAPRGILQKIRYQLRPNILLWIYYFNPYLW